MPRTQGLQGLPYGIRTRIAGANADRDTENAIRDALRDPGSRASQFVKSMRAHRAAVDAAQAAGLDNPLHDIPGTGPKYEAPQGTLPCQSENISQLPPERALLETVDALRPRRKTPLSSSYRRRRAFEVEENVIFALWDHGRRIAARNGEPAPDRENAVALGSRYALEFTVTLPGNVDPLESAKEFGARWNEFNRQWLRVQPWARAFLQVKECHKSGKIHAHHLLLIDRDPWQDGKPPKFYTNKAGKLQVIGRTCAPWLPELWARLRGGLLEKYGLGPRHTLQPIQKAGKFSKYLSKYLTKGFKEDRPAHLKHVRLVGYSAHFPRTCRVFAYRPFFDALRGQLRCRITYRTKEKRHPETGEVTEESREAKRWDMQTAFSFNGPANIYRRGAMARINPLFGAHEYPDLPRIFGARWAWYLEPLYALEPPPGGNWAELTDGALAYKLAGISRCTSLQAQFINPQGRMIEFDEMESLPDETRRECRFAWAFIDQASGEIIGSEIMAERLHFYFIHYEKAARTQAAKVAAGHQEETRTTGREYFPL